VLFWNVDTSRPQLGASGASPRLVGAALWLLCAGVLMSLGAAPILRYTGAAAAQLQDRAAYARAVLGPQGEAADSVRPYQGRVAPGGTR
jgi:multicomponent K+:H+ antiporter subunit D